MSSSGKSSSMATALLLVAVVLAGTCASGAQASFDITNNCIKTVIIGQSLIFGGSFHLSGLPSAFFVSPFTIIVRGIPVVTITVGTKTLDWLKQQGDRLHKVEIRCDSNTDCITLYATYTPLLNPGTNTTVSLGSFCP